MSKIYKGWKILKMTEEGKFKKGDRIHNDITGYEFDGELWIDIDDKSIGVEISEFINKDFEFLITPVSFIEALNSYKKCWVEHPYINWVECSSNNAYTKKCFLDLIHHKPQTIKNILHILGWKCSSNDAFMDIIKNGKWYIEE